MLVTTLRTKIECKPFKPARKIKLAKAIGKLEEEKRKYPKQKIQNKFYDSSYSKYK